MVIGGMGPTAGARFYTELITLFQRRRGAILNHEFPEIILHSIPTPDNVASSVGPQLLHHLIRSVHILATAGCDLVAIPCNSAHLYFEQLQNTTTLPILNIVEESAEAVSKTNCQRVLILGTHSTIRGAIYQRALNRRGIESETPTSKEQRRLTRAILGICSGVGLSKSAELVQNIIDAHTQVDGILLGCTELPLVAEDLTGDVPFFDSNAILGKAAFECAIGKRSVRNSWISSRVPIYRTTDSVRELR